jgi:uracil phosphoribosyltransferase
MIHELSHPIVKSLVNRLRETDCDALRFRHQVGDLARLLCYEAFGAMPLIPERVTTWQGEAEYGFIDGREIVFVPVLRAGLPMLEPLLGLFPESAAGFLAMKRDERTHQALLYYDRVPECRGKTVVLLDPMVATGGSLIDAITLLKGKEPGRIVALNIIGSPEGLEVVERKHPDIELFIAQVDRRLDVDKFIHPGLGDAGDRAYNTPES